MMLSNPYKLKQDIIQIVNTFGHLIPEGGRIDCYTFAGLIKKHYSLNNPITNKYFNIVRENIELFWENRENKIKVVKI